MLHLWRKLFSCLALFLHSNYARSQVTDYIIDGIELELNDIKTGINDVLTPFVKEPFEVVTLLSWLRINGTKDTDNYIDWSLFVDGTKEDEGRYTFENSRELPKSIVTGQASVSSSGAHDVVVKLSLDGEVVEAEKGFYSYAPILSLIPLVVIVVLAIGLNIIEVSMGFGVFVAAAMVTGSIREGFTRVLDVYIHGAVANEEHVYVYLFTFFLSALVALMEKSGGLSGFANALSKYATTPKSGQLIAFLAGLIIFFDDYANTLVVGQMFRPITDQLSVCCEKLAFLVDATAAPIASIMPISSWVGFEVGMIQAELDKIIAQQGKDNLPDDFPTSGMDAFLKTIQYSYYSIFMLMFVPLMTLLGRDYGPMLIAERKVMVYGRTDGGPGNESKKKMKGSGNSPNEDTPHLWYNMIIPLILLVSLIFSLLVKTGNDGSGTQTLTQKIQNSDSFLALLLATMGTALCMLLLYSIQIVKDGKVVKPTTEVLKEMWHGYRNKSFEEDNRNTLKFSTKIKGTDTTIAPHLLMTLPEFVESFIHGMEGIFPALIVLTLAWAVGTAMVEVGADRLFAHWITGGNINAAILPTLSYVISCLMALATGSSWGVMTIMFPLIVGPAFEASGDNMEILYGTIAGILSGAIYGDHVSPISDTTVLSSLASGCQLMQHVKTQAPYALMPGLFAMIWGTLPVAFGLYNNGVAILLGFLTMLSVALLIAVPPINKTGRFDIFTELYMMFHKNSELHTIKEDTKKAFERVKAGEDLRGSGKDKLEDVELVPDKLVDEDEDVEDIKESVVNDSEKGAALKFM